jgi:hypothetical protein
MRQAAAVITRTLEATGRGGAKLTDIRRSELENHRAACIAALGDWRSGGAEFAAGEELLQAELAAAKRGPALRLATQIGRA